MPARAGSRVRPDRLHLMLHGPARRGSAYAPMRSDPTIWDTDHAGRRHGTDDASCRWSVPMWTLERMGMWITGAAVSAR